MGKLKKKAHRPKTSARQFSRSLSSTLLRALSSRRFVLTLLFVIISLELAILGMGVSGRMQTYVDRMTQSQYELYEHDQRKRLEEWEQEMIRERQGSATLGKQNTIPHTDASDESTAPPLRPRDVSQILDEETDALIEALQREEEEEALAAAREQEANNAATNTAPKLEEGETEEIVRLIREGRRAMIAGDMRRSILYFEEARTLHPQHPAMLYYYGMTYDKLLNPAKAREFYMEILKLRSKAGEYYQKASRRLTYGFSTPADMRGKLSFGTYQQRNDIDEYGRDIIEIAIPVLLAPNEELRPEEIIANVRVFEMVNKRNLEPAYATPLLRWDNRDDENPPTWEDGEEWLIIRYSPPDMTADELATAGERSYYGFVAKLYYGNAPMDCLSTPSVLILHENQLTNRSNSHSYEILPDDGLDSSLEDAAPASEFNFDDLF